MSERLDDEARALLGLERPLHVRRLADGHRRYLAWHRERVFDAHTADTEGAPGGSGGMEVEPTPS